MNQKLQPLPSSASTSQLLCFSIFAVLITGTYAVDEPTVDPGMNRYIPLSLIENVTYVCHSISMPGETSLIWEIGGLQIKTNTQYVDAIDEGIYIEPQPTDNAIDASTLFISKQARETNRILSIRCLASQSLIDTRKGPEYNITTYDQPTAMDSLQLVPSDEDLILEWDRPDNVPSEVVIYYTVIIDSTNETMTNYNENFTTTKRFFSLQFLQDRIMNDSAGGDCIMFELSVFGSNDAGTGPLTTIMDTIPISVDIRKASETLKVERVNLDPLLIEISFLPVTPCNMKYPLRNYTIRVDNVSALTFDDMKLSKEDERIHVELNDTTLPGVTLDGSFNLTITACNDITCRESDPADLNTTDVQDIKAVFYKNRLFLRCTFAGGSKAQGCVLKLTLPSGNDTEPEEFNILRKDGDMKCFDTNNRLEAYEDKIVFDVEEDGSRSNISLPVVPINVSIAEEFTRMTECSAAPSTIKSSEDTSKIVGGVLGPSLFIVAAACIIIPIVIAVVCNKKKKVAKPGTKMGVSLSPSDDGPSGGIPLKAPPSQSGGDDQTDGRRQPDSGETTTEILQKCGIWLSSDKKNIICINLRQLVQSLEAEEEGLKINFT